MTDSMNRSPTIIPASSTVQDAYPEVTALGYRAHLSPDVPSVELDLSEEWNRLHERWRDRNPSEVATIPEIAAYAKFYERIGLDPTETPPSVQNLIERFLLTEPLDNVPTIHPIVDVVNVAAVKSLISLGVFDSAALDGPPRLALTDGGESFRPLGSNESTTLPPDVFVFRDDETVLSQFGYRDGNKQKITPPTRYIWLLGCRVPGIGDEDVKAGLHRALELLQRGYNVRVEEP